MRRSKSAFRRYGPLPNDEGKWVRLDDNRLVPLQCGDDCKGEHENAPGCFCETFSSGETKCSIRCEQDVYFQGTYMDSCGLPRKVTRCAGFLRRKKCSDEHIGDKIIVNNSLGEPTVRTERYDVEGNLVDWFGELPIRLHVETDGLCARAVDPKFDLRYLLKDNDMISINGERFKVSLNVLKISEALVKCIQSIRSAPADEKNSFVILSTRYMGVAMTNITTYKEPRLDSNCEACRTLRIISHQIDEAENRLTFYYTLPQWDAPREVVLRADDPRAEYFFENEIGRKGFSQCDFLNGYGGRMCQVCLPTYARQGQYGCIKCPPLSTQYFLLIGGILAGITALVFTVTVVISDAGSTSTASTLKRIVLNHAQLVAICMNFDLNWSPAAQDLFSLMGSMSSIGEQLIQADCLLNRAPNRYFRPFYVKQIIYAGLAIFCILGAALFWYGKAWICCCCEDKRKKHKNEKRVKLATELLDMHRGQVRNRWFRAKNNILAHMYKGKKNKFERLALISNAANKKLITKAQMKRAELEAYGVEDPAAQDALLADREAIAKLRARELMAFVKEYKIDLKALFVKHAPDSHHLGEMDIKDFILLLKSLGFKWPPEDYECVADLFDASFHDGRVHLSTLTAFGKTATDNFIVTLTVILYILYPTIARMLFKQLACRGGLQDGEYEWYLLYDIQSPCYSAAHYAFIICVGLPTFVIYIAGFPVFGLLTMKRRIDKYGWTDDTLMYRYAVLMSGYRHGTWWWELMISGRKVLLISIGVFMGTYGTEVQFFCATLVIVTCLTLQAYCRPFVNDNLTPLKIGGLRYCSFRCTLDSSSFGKL